MSLLSRRCTYALRINRTKSLVEVGVIGSPLGVTAAHRPGFSRLIAADQSIFPPCKSSFLDSKKKFWIEPSCIALNQLHKSFVVLSMVSKMRHGWDKTDMAYTITEKKLGIMSLVCIDKELHFFHQHFICYTSSLALHIYSFRPKLQLDSNTQVQ